MVGDLTDERFLSKVLPARIDSIFHLAATLTVDAERDFHAGWSVNLELPFQLLESCRQSGHAPRFVYASSIAVFGGQLPERVGEDHLQRPRTSYGTAKAMVELLINDYTRHGLVDGRALRLPIVVVRPGEPVASVSDRIAALVREPLRGQPVSCPVERTTRFPVVSVRRATENLVRLHDADAAMLRTDRAVNQPGLSVTPADIIAALERVVGADTATLVGFEPDAAIQRAVASWPREFATDIDLHPPLAADPDFETILRGYLADISSGQGQPAAAAVTGGGVGDAD
jgi:D-erythronate 2-dehydrogenase